MNTLFDDETKARFMTLISLNKLIKNVLFYFFNKFY